MQQDNLFSASAPEQVDLPSAKIVLWRNWLAHEQAIDLYHHLVNTLEWSQPEIALGGRSVLIPRLQVWFGDAEARYAYSGTQFVPVTWPQRLVELKQQVEAVCDCRFNSLLANFYRDGNDSVAYHADDEPELGEHPVIASLSLGETRRFLLKPRPGGTIVHRGLSIDLANGDLLTMSGATQRHWHHSVPKSKKPLAGRINLTFRLVNHDPVPPTRHV